MAPKVNASVRRLTVNFVLDCLSRMVRLVAQVQLSWGGGRPTYPPVEMCIQLLGRGGGQTQLLTPIALKCTVRSGNNTRSLRPSAALYFLNAWEHRAAVQGPSWFKQCLCNSSLCLLNNG